MTRILGTANGRRRWRRARACGLLAFAASGVLAACGGSSSKGASASPAASTAAVPADVPVHIAVTGDAQKMWMPKDIHVRSGKVIFDVTSTGKTHNFVIAGVTAGKTGPIFPGQTVHLALTLAPGHYTFKCTYHHTMTGTITVT